MAKNSIHFVLKGSSSYKDLAPVFEDILKFSLQAVDQMPEEEEMEMIVRLNLEDLERDRKPEGYLRKARIRIVFPMDRKEFYIQSYNAKLVDLGLLSNHVKSVLAEAGIQFDYSEDDAITFDINPKKR